MTSAVDSNKFYFGRMFLALDRGCTIFYPFFIKTKHVSRDFYVEIKNVDSIAMI